MAETAKKPPLSSSYIPKNRIFFSTQPINANYCHYSYDNDNYKNESPLEEEESSRCHVTTTDGDNTGTHDSLAGVPSRWGMAQPEPVKIVGFHGTSHDDLQKNPAVMQYLREVLVNTSKATIVAS